MENLDIPIDEYQVIPNGLKAIDLSNIRKVFPNPSLIYLTGQKKEPIFLSLLLHGNETTSFDVLKNIQNYLSNNELPRSLIIFVGNVYAAEKSQRFIEGQQDYNRIWKAGDSQEHHMAQLVIEKVKKHFPLFACVDIHNNTGANPLYACINKLDQRYIHLGSLFSRTMVYFHKPDSALSVYYSQYTPAVTIECGQSGNPKGVEQATQFILDLMHIQSLEHKTPPSDCNIHQTMAQILVKDGVSIGFSDSDNSIDLNLTEELENLNFTPLEPGNLLGRSNLDNAPIQALNDQGDDVFLDYFQYINGEIRNITPIVPSMFTKDKNIIKKDCLGYIMKPLNLSK